MKRPVRPVALCLILLLTACSAPKPDAPPPPPPQVTAVPPGSTPVDPTPAVNPQTKPVAPDLATTCDGKAGGAERVAAMLRYITGQIAGTSAREAHAALQKGDLGCISAETDDKVNLLLLTAREGFGLGPAAIAWLEGSSWRVAPILVDGKSPLWFLNLGAVRLVDGRPELFLEARSGGSGGWVGLFHVQTQPDGTALTIDTHRGFGRGGVTFLRFDLVLATLRAKLYEMIPDCNGCVPSVEQVLMSWDGQKFVTLAQRMAVDPEVALNLLLFHLRKGDTKTAAEFAADASVLDAVKRIEWGSGWYRMSTDVYPVRDREMDAWDALPSEFRRPTSPQQSVFTAVVQTKTASIPVLFTRKESGWVVARIDVVGNPPTAAAVSRADAVAALSALQGAQPAGVSGALGQGLHALQHYLLTSPDSADGDLPLVRFLPVAGTDMRLVHLGDEAFVRRYGTGWTWIQWRAPGNRIDLIQMGDRWLPKVATVFGDKVAVISESPLEPGARRVSFYQRMNETWDTVSLYSLYDDLKLHGFDVAIDMSQVTVRGNVSVRPDGAGLSICKPGGSCLEAVWKNGAYQPSTP